VGSIDVFLQPKNQYHLSYERFFLRGSVIPLPAVSATGK
jgi:hypothetical protein